MNGAPAPRYPGPEAMDDTRLRALPKIELHLHLEGAIPLPALWNLMQRYGGDEDVPDIGALERRFRYSDFPHFIRTWVWKNGFLRDYDDFTFIADAVAADLADQGIVYAEAFCSPGDFARHGLELQPLITAIRQGLDRQKHRITVELIPDLIRDFGPEKGMRWLHQAREVRDQGLVAIGLGGSEHEFPPEAYEGVYEEARKLGFRTTAHAGEAAGAPSIWGALRRLKVDRIGHGTRAVEDPALISYLAEHRIGVEACPVSNVRTGVIESLDRHPIQELLDAGVLVSVNTDDPKMFDTSLADEFAALSETFGFGLGEIETLTLNAVDCAFCDETTKAALRQRVHAAFAVERD